MRTIKFRAKRLSDGAWVYGDLIIKPIHHDCCILENGVINHSVDPETVGQFTGLEDLGGHEIYEGHIIISESGKNICSVEWGVINCRIKGFPKHVDDSMEMHGWIVRNHKLNLIGELDCSFYSGEIIGNIYDNPELLK